MKPIEVHEYFGSYNKFHRQTGMSKCSLFNWKKQGYVPELSQIKLQILTKGGLKAEIEGVTK